jgi:uncharacterized RDD family membrane protein YckC
MTDAPNMLNFDGIYRLETPEQIEVDYELAGPGSRYMAILLDWIVLGVAVIIIWLGVLALAAGGSVFREISGLFNEGELPSQPFFWAVALAIVVTFLLMFGYYTTLETIWRGQTIGKRVAKIRTIRDDGTPISFIDVLLRNLLRIVDVLPVFYVVGGAASFFHPMHKRLGDLAAGTIVVKERELQLAPRERLAAEYARDRVPTADAVGVAPTRDPFLPGPEAPAEPTTPTGPTASPLSAEERRLVSAFLERRESLMLAARAQFADRLARRLWDKHGGYWHEAESYLERVLEGRHHGAP